MHKLFGALAAAAMLSVSAMAFAGEPLQLSDQQMDNVTAGAAGGISVLLSATSLGGTGGNLADTTAIASITQTPFVITTPVGPVTLQNALSMATASSTSSN
jgi:hypothetical protein